MATENPVYNILVTSGNQALLAAGSRVDALAVGQLGMFNYHTGLSVDGTVIGDTRDVYLALGLGTGGVLADIKRSAGQVIQQRNVKNITLKPYVGSLPKIVELTGFKAKCETDYSLRIEYRNQQSYGVNGYNQLANTYNYRTGCCTQIDCTACPQGDCNELAIGLAKQINADPNKLATATFFVNKLVATTTGASANGTLTMTVGTETFSVAVLSGDTATDVAAKIVAAINTTTTSAYTATNLAGVISVYPKSTVSGSTAAIALTAGGGSGVTFSAASTSNVDVVDTAAYIAANPLTCLSLRITGSNGTNVPFNCDIPIKYYNAKETDIIVSLTDSFECNGTVTTIQNLQYEDGIGYNLAYEEYFAEGWGVGGPYRTSSITGLGKKTYTSAIDKAAHYNVVSMDYDQFSVGGWLEYLNNLRTIIAIPCADTVTLISLFTIFDLIYTQFGAGTNDATAADCTNVSTNLINNYALDGIESLT